MAALSRRPIFFWIILLLAGSLLGLAQGTSLTMGPLSVTVPPGWKPLPGLTADGPSQFTSPDSTPQQYLQLSIFPPQDITQDVREYHSLVLSRMSAMIPPGSPQQNGTVGQFIWTSFQLQRPGSQPETMVLYSAKTGSQYVGVGLDASQADILNRNLPALEAMLKNASLGGPAAPGSAAAPASNALSGSGAPIGSMATLDDYVFSPPPGWRGTKYTDALTLNSPQVGSEVCFISFWPMRPAGPSLEADANRLFYDVYKQYQQRNVDGRGASMPPVMIRGTSGQGWDYVIVKRGIGPPGSREVRLGFAMVARLGDRLAAISGLSKDPLVSACFGELQKNVWPAFFYSLSFRNWAPQDTAAAMRQTMLGEWTIATASVADQITFAASGRYGGASARQQYNAIGNGEVLATTTAYFGDGAYTLQGNRITLKPDNRPAQPGFVRVEEESQDEGRTWRPILYLMRKSSVDGEDYEVRYKKTR